MRFRGVSLGEIFVWVLIGGILVYSIREDLREGAMRLSRPGGGRRQRQKLKRAEHPMLFVTMHIVRVFGAVVLGLLLTGRLIPLLQSGI